MLNIHPCIKELSLKLKSELPGIESQKKMLSQFQKNNIEYFNKNQKLKEAAVLIILFEDNNVLKTVFIERTPHPGPHSGQIAFPGGKKEIFDNDLIDTAIRETYEEVGIKINKNNILGKLTPIEIPISGYSVLPVVSFVENIPIIKKCEKEVNDTFTVDLMELFNSKTIRKVYARETEIEAPCYIFDNQIIWGATAMVLSEFEDIINQT